MNRLTFLILQALHILIYFLAAVGGNFVGLAASGSLVVLFYSLLIYREVRHGQWAATPLVAYLGMSTLRVGLGAIYLAVAYMGGYAEEMRFVSFDAEPFAMQGHLLLMAGDWLLLTGYFAVEALMRRREARMPLRLDQGGVWLTPVGMSLVFLGMGVRGVSLLGVNVNVFGQFVGMLGYAAPAGVFLLLVESGRSRGVGQFVLYGIVSGILVVQLAIALRGFMKDDAMVTLLPLAIYFAERMRARRLSGRIGWKWVLLLAIVGYFVVVILFPFNGMRRMMIIKRGSAPVISVLQEAFAASVPFTEAFSKTHEFPREGAWTFMKRNEWTTAAGWAVFQVENEGTISGETLVEGVISIIPRIFWPNKPPISRGGHFAVLMGQATSFEETGTSTGLGLAASLYWNGAVFALVVGMLLNGLAFALTWEVIRPRILSNPVAAIVYIILIRESLRWFEGQFDGSLAFYVYIWVVFVPLMFLVQAIGPASWRANWRTQNAVAG